jgi:hypothetical protein
LKWKLKPLRGRYEKEKRGKVEDSALPKGREKAAGQKQSGLLRMKFLTHSFASAKGLG